MQKDASGAPTLTDLGAIFSVASTTNALTLTLFAAPNSGGFGVRVFEEVAGRWAGEAMLDISVSRRDPAPEPAPAWARRGDG